LFGLNFAKEAIRKQDEAGGVEGQMDCISVHQAGFKNVVASSGTALTEAGLMQLARLTKNLKFCFDADAAGQTASLRAGELALKQGFRLKVIVLDKVKDPDELVKKSPGLWEKAVNEAVWFLDWQMDVAEKKFSADPVEQKHYLSEQVVPLLGAISDPLEQDHYVHKLATRFLISEKTILEQIKKQATGKKPEVLHLGPNLLNGSLLLEKEVLGGLIVSIEFLKEVKELLKKEDFENLEIKEMAGAVLSGQTSGPNFASSALAKEAQFMVESQLDELGGNAAALHKELLKSFAILKIGAIKKRQQNIQGEIKNAEKSNNKARIDELNREFAQISSERIKYEVLL
jgi:DNA primase